MATHTMWQPKEEGLTEICGVLEQHISPTSDKSRIWQQLEHYSQFPDFNNYLAFIFAHAEGKAIEIRQAAGLLLKNNVKRTFKSIDPAYQQLIKSELLPCPGAADKNIRTTVGTIISAVVQQGGISGWPELLQALMQCLDSNDISHMEGAMDTLSKVDPVSAGVQYDKEFMVCSLDLLSGLTESLGSGIESLLSPSNLRDLLLQCCMDDAPDVRQSALALLGDLARVSPGYLHPRLSEFLNVAAKQLGNPEVKEYISVANNACWAIGELAVKVRQEVSPIVVTIVSSLVSILQHAEELNRSLVENSAITLGRLALVCPEIVSPHMEHFMQLWCTALSMIRDGIEKEDAFRGLCAIVRANPSGALNSLLYMCKAIASWHVIRSESLHNEVCQVLRGYKQMLGDGAWEQCLSALEPPMKQKLSKCQV